MVERESACLREGVLWMRVTFKSVAWIEQPALHDMNGPLQLLEQRLTSF